MYICRCSQSNSYEGKRLLNSERHHRLIKGIRRERKEGEERGRHVNREREREIGERKGDRGEKGR